MLYPEPVVMCADKIRKKNKQSDKFVLRRYHIKKQSVSYYD